MMTDQFHDRSMRPVHHYTEVDHDPGPEKRHYFTLLLKLCFALNAFTDL
jgi:hypothetical protein